MIAAVPEWLAEFIAAGGNVMWALLAVTILLWTLILERLWFYRFAFPRRARNWQAEWRQRSDHSSWRARAIRDLMVSRADAQLRSGLRMLNTLIAISPMLGLLGTVTGMLQVFDVMALKGTSDPRAMAGGISQALVTTVTGLVVALSGLYFATRFPQRARQAARQLADRLDIHHEAAGS